MGMLEKSSKLVRTEDGSLEEKGWMRLRLACYRKVCHKRYTAQVAQRIKC